MLNISDSLVKRLVPQQKNSQGFAFSTLATYSPSPRLTYKIRYRYKTKQRDIPRHKGTLQYAELHKLTLTTISLFSAE